nr:hypothetical protein [Bacteroidaceae bacterium]
VLTDGVIQVNGYGDPIGNHRNISREAGRSPNFTAIAHKTYFGSIPDVRIPLTPVREFVIRLDCNVEDADVDISFNGTSLTPDSNGEYSGTYGTYSITAGKTGYRCYRRDYIIGDDAEGVQTFAVEMIATENAWDGKTVSEPEAIDNIYQLSSGAELAWFAGHINAKAEGQNAVLTRDIDLGDYDWTPIGTSANIPYSGVFNGDGHSISGLYIGNPEASYQGLFGYLKNGEISNVTVDGTVSAKQYVGGIAGMLHDNACIDRCVNLAEISGTSYVGGIAGSLSRESSTISNSYNVGNIVAGSNGGGIVGMSVNTATVENVFSIGNVSGRLAGACVGSAAALTNIYNAFSIFEYDNTNGQTLVTEEQMRSGEIAYRLGEAFGQEIGVDAHPVLGGKTVMYDETENRYYNEPVTGISDILVPTKNCNAVYYNLDGTASRRPHTGINIIRTTDGSIRKVVIR